MLNITNFANSSISVRIWRIVAFSLSLTLIFVVLLSFSLLRVQRLHNSVTQTQMVIQTLQLYEQNFLNSETAQRGYLLTGQAIYLAPFIQAQAENQSQFLQLNSLTKDLSEHQKIERLGFLFNTKSNELKETIDLAQKGNLDEALALVKQGEGLKYTQQFEKLASEIFFDEKKNLEILQVKNEYIIQAMLAIALIGSLLAVLSIVIYTFKVVKSIDVPLDELLKGIEAVSAGQMNQRVIIYSSDEIGFVAKRFNKMADDLVFLNGITKQNEIELLSINQKLRLEIEQRGTAQRELSKIMNDLNRSNEELDNFAYSASHDLKAPLRGIRNLSTWISADVKDIASEETMENLSLLHNRVERLDALLDSLLQYSRIGRIRGTPQNINVPHLVKEISDYVAQRPGFRVIYDGDPIVIYTYKAPLQQILQNLIENSLKHHDRDNGTITVTASDRGNFIDFQIMDDGPGIPSEFHERIFQMFRTLKPRDEIEGSGMGLAIVKKSVEANGGMISVKSFYPHRGSTFIFTWQKSI